MMKVMPEMAVTDIAIFILKKIQPGQSQVTALSLLSTVLVL